ncbi:hypothetical protein Taro_042754 [Colocasia esculenta]|uniref:Uncharacterized protein n=1 Tax=Colocasia esculenta TaxID=4460 RepID=A0A843X063_COLES|nr:hypothetical protein [Colocasia esculenta]
MLGDLQMLALGRRHPGPSRPHRDGVVHRVPNRKWCLNTVGHNRARYALFGQREVLRGFPGVLRCGSLRFGVFSPRGVCVEREKHCGIAVLRALHGGSTTRTVVTSPVGCPWFSVIQAVSSGLVPVLVLYRRGSTTPTMVTTPVGCPRFSVSQAVSSGLVLGEFPTEPVTSEAHPYSPQVKVRRRFRYRLPVQSRAAAVLGQRPQQCSLNEAFRHNTVLGKPHFRQN